MQQVGNLTEKILSLPEKERAKIAKTIIASLGDYDDADYEKEWKEEIERRAQEVINKKESGKRAEKVFNETSSRLK